MMDYTVEVFSTASNINRPTFVAALGPHNWPLSADLVEPVGLDREAAP